MITSQTPFTAILQHGSLTVAHRVEGRSRTLCLVELARPYTIRLDGPAVACRTRHGEVLIQSPAGTDAAELLGCISEAVTRHEQRRKAITTASGLALMIALAAIFISPAFPAAGFNINFGVEPAHRRVSLGDQLETSAALPAVKPTEPIIEDKVKAMAQPTHDGWSLPQSIREILPAKLKLAAERKIFTVDYSSGHSRTLYVFADPECPNCQRMEPALEAAAKDFNVIVFPVAVIGRERSIASITPVLCLPPEQRKTAWSNLFDIGRGVMELGKAEQSAAIEPGDCDSASKALGVNEVAYQAYRIPGTPWVIADDGRYVSQEVLQNSMQLQAFMGVQEVSHAAE